MSIDDYISQARKLEFLPIGSKITFKGEKQPYSVRATSGRFLVCTKPYNPKRTVIYTVVDLVEHIRGTENLIFGMGAETDEDCREMIDRLEGREGNTGGFRTEVSHRNRVDLEVVNVEYPKQKPPTNPAR